MFTQKLYKTGNSIAVTIPKQLLEKHNLKEGSEIVLEEEDKKITITSKNNKLAPDVDAEFMKMIEQFADEHDDVLRELAKR